MATMRLTIDPETKAAAHAASGRAGMRFNGWLIRLIRRTVGLSDEVPLIGIKFPENQTIAPATPLADVDVSEVKSGGGGSGISEMDLSSRLMASIKQANARKEKP